jgi:single-stranded-DNA-specific exonuclease
MPRFDTDRHWARLSARSALLLPVSWLFRLAVELRRLAFRIGWARRLATGVPVIVVGNVTVGGTGKTPLTIWLVLSLISRGWHPGVVGIVAARLKEATNRPAVVIGFEGDAGKGSARSVSGVDLGASIQRLAAEGLIEKGGGHRMAAGLSLTRAQLDPAMARLAELLAKQGAGDRGPSDLRLDGLLMPAACTVALIEQLDEAGPFGASAPAPRFALPGLRIRYTKPVGQGHLKLTLSDGAASLEAICFNAAGNGLQAALEGHGGRALHVAGRIEINHWNGRQSVQLQLEDAAWAE